MIVRLAEALAPHRALASRPDREILHGLVQLEDEGKDFLIGDNCYSWYWALGRLLRPTVIAEIGVRYGYSLAALARGVLHGGAPRLPVVLHGFDCEADLPGSLAVARFHLNGLDPRLAVYLTNLDTQSVMALAVETPNLFHVDGQHTYEGVWHDMHLAWQRLAPGGLLLVDDYAHCPEVGRAVDAFVRETSVTAEILPTLRGLATLWRS